MGSTVCVCWEVLQVCVIARNELKRMEKLIKAFEKYIYLTDSDRIGIEHFFRKKELRVNDCFLQAGQTCKEFAFVEHGLLRHYINIDGNEETFYFSAENDFVCDYESFINRAASNKTIIALEDSVIYTISYDNLQLFYEKITEGEKFGRKLLEEIFTAAIKHIVTTFTQSAEDRYINFLSNFKHIQSRIPQYYIASFIGVTPQSLSRIRRKIAKK